MPLVSEAMSRAFTTVPADASAAQAAALASTTGAEHLLVVYEDNLVGVLCCECDLSGAAPGELVADLMTVPVFTVRPDAPLEEAAITLRDCRVGCLPVATGGLLLGVLTAAAVPGAHRPGHPAGCSCHARLH
jgi:acetoin utilization protein AcuB